MSDHNQEEIKTHLMDENFIKCSFSSPKLKSQKIKSIHIQANKNQKMSIEIRYEKHNNILKYDKKEFINDKLEEYISLFKQCLIKTTTLQQQYLINKKNHIRLVKTSVQNSPKNQQQKKQYLLQEGEKIPFLMKIGVMDTSGRVKSKYYKKFKQINRFLEMVDDLFKNEQKKQLNIIDFGCGKSYLTFALYHYFTHIKKISVSITGIDLKQDVIDHCNQLANELEFSQLQFKNAMIHEFQTKSTIDFVVTLHACDTATDEAIYFSIKHQAKKMMFVPCCQHQLFEQIRNEDSDILLSHGIFKDKLVALVTDTARAQLLEAVGYKVQCMEFIDLEHTAKNIMLRCTRVERSLEQNLEKLKKYQAFKAQWQIAPYLEKKLTDQGVLKSQDSF